MLILWGSLGFGGHRTQPADAASLRSQMRCAVLCVMFGICRSAASPLRRQQRHQRSQINQERHEKTHSPHCFPPGSLRQQLAWALLLTRRAVGASPVTGKSDKQASADVKCVIIANASQHGFKLWCAVCEAFGVRALSGILVKWASWARRAMSCRWTWRQVTSQWLHRWTSLRCSPPQQPPLHPPPNAMSGSRHSTCSTSWPTCALLSPSWSPTPLSTTSRAFEDSLHLGPCLSSSGVLRRSAILMSWPGISSFCSSTSASWFMWPMPPGQCLSDLSWRISLHAPLLHSKCHELSSETWCPLLWSKTYPTEGLMRLKGRLGVGKNSPYCSLGGEHESSLWQSVIGFNQIATLVVISPEIDF